MRKNPNCSFLDNWESQQIESDLYRWKSAIEVYDYEFMNIMKFKISLHKNHEISRRTAPVSSQWDFRGLFKSL